jgi:tripartite-type tricarboxylate transporter receptor subunit TctC
MRGLALGMVMGLITAGSVAQPYPAKPVRMIVGFPSGGGNDIIARIVGQRLGELLGQPVVIDNRPGANAIIATEAAAKSPPDGYTLLVGAIGAMAINPALYPKLPYDSIADFNPVTTLGLFPMVLAVHPSVPARTVKELVALAGARAGRLDYASGASAFHFATEMFKQMAGVDLNHIPYKGSAQSINAALAGDVQLIIVDIAPVVQQIKSGKLRGLAVTTHARSTSLPELPTMTEAGVPGYGMALWTGLFAPAGTPAPVIARLHAAVVRALQTPDVVERLAALGVEPVGDTPEQLGATLKADIERFGRVARAANMKPD